MLSDASTSDILHISEPPSSPEKVDQVCAIDCTNYLLARVGELVASSVSDSTRRAYLSDITQFSGWGGSIPATPEMVATYVAAHADTLTVATLVRRVATLSKVHEARGLPNPCRTEIVRATLRGLKRTKGTAHQQAKPLLREDLMLIMDKLSSTTKDQRDRALLLLGFAGGFRRSELVGLDCTDIERVRQGLVVTLKRCKTDQEGAGRKIGIPLGRTRYCPVAALDKWLLVCGIDSGPVFRPLDRTGRVSIHRLSGDAVSIVIRERAAAAGIDPSNYSGHSLRAGFCTSAAQAGVSALKIRAQTGHASDAMLARYIRDAELFIGNASGALL